MAIVKVSQTNTNVGVVRVGQQGPAGDAGDVVALGPNLTSIGSLTMSANQLIYSTGPGAFTQTGITSFGRSLINDTSASVARTTLGVVIGTDVQAYNADLTAWAGKTAPSGAAVGTTDTQTLTNKSLPTDTVLFVDPTDATKKLAFSISGFTSGTTRTLTWPNADGTIATTEVVAAGYQPLDSDLTAIAALTSAANKLPYATGSSTWALTDFTSFGRSLVDDADASAARTTLGVAIGTDVQAYNADLTAWAGKTAPSGAAVGTTDTQTLTNKSLPTDTVVFVDPTDATKKLAFSISGFTSGTTRTITIPNSSDTLVNTGTAQTLLNKKFVADNCQFRDSADATKIGAFSLTGITTGTTRTLTWPNASGTIATKEVVAAGYQPLDSDLTAIAALTSAANKLPYATGSASWSLTNFTAFGRSLVDDADASTARTTLGLGTMSTETATNYVDITSTQTVAGSKTFSAAAYFTNQNQGIYIRPIGFAGLLMGRIDGTATTAAITFNTGATATTYDSRIRATGGTGTDGGGTVDILSAKLTSTGTYSTTTANAANVNVASNGTLARSTSSEKYKIDIEPMSDEWADKLLELEPIFYRSTCELDNPEWSYYGLSAEAVAAVDKRLVHWRTTETHNELDDDGNLVPIVTKLETPEPEGVAYDRLVCHLITIVKRQNETIKELSAKVDSIVG